MDVQKHYDSLIFTDEFLGEIVESQHSSVLLQQTTLNSCILVLSVIVTNEAVSQSDHNKWHPLHMLINLNMDER
jgi:hypothetical protein